MKKQGQGTTLIHFIFTTKFRYLLLEDATIAGQVEGYMRHAAAVQGMEVRAIAVQPEHVHIMVILPRTLPVSVAAQELKRFSSLIIRKQYPKFRSLPGLWGRRYYHHSVGGGAHVINSYIEQQMREFSS